MPRFGFPRQARLLRKRDFMRVYSRDSVRLRLPPLRACALRRSEGQSRLGLAVGRKVGKAVVRNRWKRAIREAFRLNRHRLRAPYDLVISVDWGAPADMVGEVEAILLEIIRRLNAAEEQAGGNA